MTWKLKKQLCVSLNSRLNFLSFLSKAVFVEEMILYLRNKAGAREMAQCQRTSRALLPEDWSLCQHPRKAAPDYHNYLHRDSHMHIPTPRIKNKIIFISLFKTHLWVEVHEAWLLWGPRAHFRGIGWWGAACPFWSITCHHCPECAFLYPAM